MRDLAYRIEKQSKGVYTLLRYQATGRAVEELERNLRMTDGILRYLTVRDRGKRDHEPEPGGGTRGTPNEPGMSQKR